jgi:hypothetical protein
MVAGYLDPQLTLHTSLIDTHLFFSKMQIRLGVSFQIFCLGSLPGGALE